MNLGPIRRHPAVAYYALVFAISWGGLFALAGPGGYPGTSAQVSALFAPALIFLFAGPSLAGPLLTGLLYGRAGLHDYRSRLSRWRVGARWYAISVLTIPVLAMAILMSLSLYSQTFLPALVTSADKAGLLLMGISIGVVGGSLEELGWTGFAVPRLKSRYGVLGTGLVVGFLWGVWHIPITAWAWSGWGSFVGPLFFYAIVLPAYRVVMVWLYDRTRSLPATMSMHWSLSASTLFIFAPGASGLPLATYYLILAIPLWALALVLSRPRNQAPDGGIKNQFGVREEEPLKPIARRTQ